MDRRIFGLENEYGVAAAGPAGLAVPTPHELAYTLVPFPVTSARTYLRNGARLYVDHGSHPEYATAECDSLLDLIAQDKAGERIIEGRLLAAEQKWRAEGFVGTLYALKNNVDVRGATYGCHENYLVSRATPFPHLVDGLMPFLVTRQITSGAGHVLKLGDSVSYRLSQRARHMDVDVGADSTHHRAIIHTRDEPLADMQRYRRLHLLVGDANMSETTTLLKVGSADLVLRMIEEGERFPELALREPVVAIRQVSRDITGRTPVDLRRGGSTTALEIQQAYCARARAFAERRGLLGTGQVSQVLELWERSLRAVDTGNLDLISRDIDWAIKWSFLQRYADKHGLDLSSPRMAQLDLSYHDVRRDRGLYYMLLQRGGINRVVGDLDVFRAKSVPPQTTRAKLRGAFVAACEKAPPSARTTIEWGYLSVRHGDEGQYRTARCTDPFASEDQSVVALTRYLREPGAAASR